MSDSNPYQAPSTDALAISAEGRGESFRFDGKDIWVRDGARLPSRCIYTNAPLVENSDLRDISKKIAWVNPFFALLIILNVIVYLIIALCVQKKGRIQFWADSKILRKKRLKSFVGLFFMLLSTAIFIGGSLMFADYGGDLLFLISLVLGLGGLLASVLYTLRVANSVRVTKYNEGWFRLAGCGKPFLDSFSVGEEVQ